MTIGKLTKEKLAVLEPARSADEIGLTVQALTPQLAKQFDAEPGEGVVVTEVYTGSDAAMAGIEPGTVILQVDQKPLKTVAEFSSEVKEGEKRNRVLLLIRQGNMQRFVALCW